MDGTYFSVFDDLESTLGQLALGHLHSPHLLNANLKNDYNSASSLAKEIAENHNY